MYRAVVIPTLACCVALVSSACYCDQDTTFAGKLERAAQEQRTWGPGAIEKLTAKALPAVAYIKHRDSAGEFSTGTGFFVSPDGLLVTCYHVIAEAPAVAKAKMDEKVWVRTATAGTHVGTVLYRNVSLDLAAVYVPVKRHPALQVAQPDIAVTLPKVGQEVVTLGYPAGDLLSDSATLTRGVVSAVRADGRIIQLDAAVNPGCSGGPVFSANGLVVGMVQMKADRLENMSFALSCQALPRVGRIIAEAVRSDPVIFAPYVNIVETNGAGALDYATDQDDPRLVKLLLQAGANTSLTGGTKGTTFLQAAKSCAVIDALVDAGADINKRDMWSHYTPVHHAAMDGLASKLECLLKHRPDLEAADDLGMRPVHVAARHGTLRCLQLLVEAGADYNAVDGLGSSPLYIAKLYLRESCANYLESIGAVSRGFVSKRAMQNAISDAISASFDRLDSDR